MIYDRNIWIAYLIFCGCMLSVMLWAITREYKYGGNPNDAEQQADTVVVYKDTSVVYKEDWDCFISAIVSVESTGKWDAKGKNNDVGVLQITPILVRDCNRILGREKYTLADRLDSLKSVEMFNVMQKHYNPQRDYHWALKLWNSGAPLSYHRKVMDKFNEIKNN